VARLRDPPNHLQRPIDGSDQVYLDYETERVSWSGAGFRLDIESFPPPSSASHSLSDFALTMQSQLVDFRDEIDRLSAQHPGSALYYPARSTVRNSAQASLEKFVRIDRCFQSTKIA